MCTCYNITNAMILRGENVDLIAEKVQAVNAVHFSEAGYVLDCPK
jgi:hypothetical protein